MLSTLLSNLSFTQLFLLPAWLAFTLAVLVTFLVKVVYQKAGWLDDPIKNIHAKTIHTKAVPRGGGIAIYVALLVCALVFLPGDRHVVGILLGATILMIIGVLDDLFNLNPYLRLVTGTLAAIAVTAVGIGIVYITNPFGPPGSVIRLDTPELVLQLGKVETSIMVLADFFAIIWIVWMMNIVNWSKGLDGQMPGFVSIAALFLGLLSFRFVDDVTQWPVITLAAITSGAFAGFLVWNAFPQKIMPGYGAGSLAGFLLAILAILSGAKVAALILILGVPIADAGFTICRRLLRGKSPVWGDRGHLHHRLLDAGWSKRRIAAFYWFTTFCLGLLTLHLTSTLKIFSIVSVSLAVGGLLISLKAFKPTYTKDV